MDRTDRTEERGSGVRKVRVAIQGLGNMGKRYAALIGEGKVPEMELAAVCTRSRGNWDWLREKAGLWGLAEVPLLCATEEELYQKSESFDAVIISTPHRLHPDSAVRAFAAGKDVLCEKPAGVKTADAKRMTEASLRAGRLYGMIYHQRTFPRFQKVREILREGALGELRRISWTDTQYFRTRAYHEANEGRSTWHGDAGGLLINQAIHLLDLWQYLFGVPESVEGKICFGKYNDFAVDDEVRLFLRYQGCLTGEFFSTTGEAHRESRLTVSGSRGYLSLDEDELTLYTYSQELWKYAEESPLSNAGGLTETKTVWKLPNQVDAYERMLINFAAAILGREELIAPGADGEITLELINGAYLSAWKGGAVSLPLDAEEYERELAEHIRKEQEG